jgi:tetratricopeptide (TPR) repeat protein
MLLAETYVSKLSSNEEAIISYRKVLELEPADSAAIGALANLYKKVEMWDELAELMRARIPQVEAEEEKTRFRHILADVLADHLDAKEDAIEVLRQVMDKNPDDIKALKGLERLYGATGRNEEYLRILNKRIDAARDDGEKIALYRRLAEEWQEQSGGLKRAAEYLVEIHKLGGANDETYRNLVRIYWELKDYNALVETYGWHIEMAERPEDRAVLHSALGRLYEEHIEDVAEAVATFEKVLEDDAKNVRALEALARLNEKQGEWKTAVERLSKLAEIDEGSRLRAYQKMGQIQIERLSELDEAEKNLAKARELSEDDVDTALSLAKLYCQRDDFGKAARMYQQVAKHTSNELEKVAHLFSAAEIYRDKINDQDKALDAYLEVLELDPEHLQSAEHAADTLIEREAYAAAVPRLETLVRKTPSDDKKLLLQRNLRLGEIALEADDNARAETALRAAYAIDPANQVALVKLADILLEKKEHAEAGKLLQALLVHRRETLPKEDVVDIFFKLSEVKQALGDEAKAHNMIEKALDVDPHNPKVLEHAIEIYRDRDDCESVLKCQRNMLKALPEEDTETRARLLEDIGDLQHRHLKRSQDAIKSYKDSLALAPKVRRVLHKKMEVHVALSQWDDALELIDGMVDIETDAAHRYRLHNTAGLIFRDELKRYHEAAEQFDKALADDPSNLTAFELLKELYLDRKEYKKLARAYRTVLARMPESTPVELRVSLWRELAEMAQTKIKDAREAIIALEMVGKLDPSASDHKETLARLYTSAGSDAFDKAVAANQTLLDFKPMHKEAYQELYRIYRSQKETDKAYNVAAVLTLLKAADSDQQAFFKTHSGNGDLRRARVSLRDDELWHQHIHHRDQVPVISDILSIVSSLFVPMAIKDREEHRLRAADQLQPQEDNRLYAQVFQYVCGVLEVSPNELYLRSGKGEMSLILVSEEEASHSHVLLLSPSVLESAEERELVFRFTRSLSLMRDEHMVLYVSPTPTVIQALVLACMRLTNPDYPIKGDVEVIDRLANAFHAELPASQVDAIAKRYDDLKLAAKPGMAEQWMRSAELTIDRAGLLLCDDLKTAARLASTGEPLAIEEGLTTKERVAQLFRYAASEDYFALRERIGLKLS